MSRYVIALVASTLVLTGTVASPMAGVPLWLASTLAVYAGTIFGAVLVITVVVWRAR